MTLEFVGKRVTTGQIDHKIAHLLKIDDLCAILAIVSLTGDAEYALGEGASPIDLGILSLD
jgi:hypothetical protein